MTKPLIKALFLTLAVAFPAWGEHGTLATRFFPSMIDTVDSMPVGLDSFKISKACADCHPTQYSQWRESMHSRSFVDPFYRAILKAASVEGGPIMDRLCVGCHTPVGTVTEFLWVKSTGEVVSDDRVNEGVSCDVCHSISDVRHLKKGEQPGNAGFIIDTGGTKYGPYDDAVSDFHPTKYSELHTKSEFCAACHNIYHPTTHTNIARTYDEWKESIYASNSIECQDCHMAPPELVVPIARDLKKPALVGSSSAWDTFRTPFFPHYFTGADVAMSTHLGMKIEPEDAKTLLRAAALLSVEGVSFDPQAKKLAFSVAIKNERAGHNLPTGMTEIRQMWTEVVVRDMGDGGRVLWSVGTLDEKGYLDRDTVLYGAHALNSKGEPTWKPWEVAKILFDNSIPPKSTSRDDHTVDVSAAKGPVSVHAELKYRSFDQKLADQYLGIAGFKVPVVVMAKASENFDFQKVAQ